jgi:hypothetical protein
MFLKLNISLKGSYFEFTGNIQKNEMVVLKVFSEKNSQHVFTHGKETDI